MIDLNELNTFIKVVEAGSFVGAAKRLNMPATTVSRKIQQLERSLQVTLLYRSTRKLSLTEQGKAYFQQCQEHINGIETANILISQLQVEPQGTLRLTAPLDFALIYLQPWINAFLLQYPGIKIEMDVSDTFKDLIEERIDIAFRSGELKDSTLIARPLLPKKACYCASPTYLAQYGEPQHPDELNQHIGVLWGNDRPQQTQLWYFNYQGKRFEVAVQGRYQTNSAQLALKAAVAGLGLIRLPTAIAHPYIEQGILQRILAQFEIQSGHIYMIYHSTQYLTKTIRLFVDFIMDKAKIYQG